MHTFSRPAPTMFFSRFTTVAGTEEPTSSSPDALFEGSRGFADILREGPPVGQ